MKNKLKVYKTPEDVPSFVSYKVGAIYNTSYHELLNILGEPTYNEPSEDDKVQREWVVNFNNEIFTIYDWKTYDLEYTLMELTEFNVGGSTSAFDLISEIQERTKKYRNDL